MSTNLRLAMEQGVSLWGALFKFGHTETARELAASIKEPILVKMIEGFAEQFGSEGKATEKLNEAARISGRQLNLRKKLETEIKRKLEQGGLIAIGYAMPRSPNDNPTQIPLDVFTGYLNWSKSEIKGNGLEFVAVQVTEPIPGLSPSRPGRHSRVSQILKAFEILMEEGEIDLEGSVRGHFSKIKRKISAIYPESKDSEVGLSEKVLYRELSPLFKKEKR